MPTLVTLTGAIDAGFRAAQTAKPSRAKPSMPPLAPGLPVPGVHPKFFPKPKPPAAPKPKPGAVATPGAGAGIGAAIGVEQGLAEAESKRDSDESRQEDRETAHTLALAREAIGAGRSRADRAKPLDHSPKKRRVRAKWSRV